jgi:hypothetical protein
VAEDAVVVAEKELVEVGFEDSAIGECQWPCATH